jgi:diguanylate cyclase (GGDEF)-like protein
MKTQDASAQRPFGSPILGGLFAALSALSGSAVALAAGWPAALIASAAAGLVAFFVLLSLGSRLTPQANQEPNQKAWPVTPSATKPIPADIPADRIDPLTGLANTNGLNAWFAEKGPRLAADGRGIVVIVARLDDFQPLIRARGQAVADAVLVEVALRVAMIAGEDGIAARTEGEEFASVVAVVPDRSEAIATERAGQLLEMIGRPVEHPSGAVWIGGSVGAASGSPLDGDGTLERARRALAAAVKLGRGQCVVDAQG